MQIIKIPTSTSVTSYIPFPPTLKLLTTCMKPDFLSTLLKEPDGFSEYVKFLINYQGRQLENCYPNTEEII